MFSLMAKTKGLSYEEKMINALKKLPNPIRDNKHRINIVFKDNRARSNESRFEHIVLKRHNLLPSDIKRIEKGIDESILRKDKDRTGTYNIYIKRNSYSEEYIKISVELDFKESNTAIVKTIFITKSLK